MFQLTVRRGAWGVVRDGAERASVPDREKPLTTPHALYLLDLPGYGYSRASKGERTAFRGLLNHVVLRPRLAGVVWLLDIRRDPSPEDLAMQDSFAAAGTRVLAALTKSDKLPRGQRLTRARALHATLALPDDQVIVTSAQTGDGIGDLREAVTGLIA